MEGAPRCVPWHDPARLLMTTPFPPATRAAHEPVRARALFYSADVAGLGNVRRTMAIVHEVARLRPDAALLGLTGGLQTHAYELPVNFDYVKLPTAAKYDLYRDVPVNPDHPKRFNGLTALRERLVFDTASNFAPQVMLVDNLPAGVGWELTRSLLHLRAAEPRTALVLGLRDVIDDPDRFAIEWQQAGHFDVMEEVFDQILVYGCPEVLDPVRELGFTPAMAAKTTVCGYVRRPRPPAPPEAIRTLLGANGAPLVVVTVGGGHLGAPLLRLYIDALNEHHASLNGVVSYIVIGPLVTAADAVIAELKESAAGIPNVQIVPFVDDLVSYLNAADLIVTMGGQTLVEGISLGKRVVALPRTANRDQHVRVQRLARLGLCTWLPEPEQSPARLALAVRDSLAGPPPVVTLDFGGRERAGQILAGLLPR